MSVGLGGMDRTMSSESALHLALIASNASRSAVKVTKPACVQTAFARSEMTFRGRSPSSASPSSSGRLASSRMRSRSPRASRPRPATSCSSSAQVASAALRSALSFSETWFPRSASSCRCFSFFAFLYAAFSSASLLAFSCATKGFSLSVCFTTCADSTASCEKYRPKCSASAASERSDSGRPSTRTVVALGGPSAASHSTRSARNLFIETYTRRSVTRTTYQTTKEWRMKSELPFGMLLRPRLLRRSTSIPPGTQKCTGESTMRRGTPTAASSFMQKLTYCRSSAASRPLVALTWSDVTKRPAGIQPKKLSLGAKGAVLRPPSLTERTLLAYIWGYHLRAKLKKTTHAVSTTPLEAKEKAKICRSPRALLETPFEVSGLPA
mmetsp:Transcript_56320/g.164620  ORF Transcript_56320/g.164620 Transcript_56320/m.164620 type:complete len:382 (+) Transcript_56320:1239-2384(+)